MSNKPDSDKTIVIFRIDKEVTAVFPEIPGSSQSRMSCYSHIGQHSDCSYAWYALKTRPASPKEYQDLKEELESLGYNLEVRKKITYRIDPRRIAAWKSYQTKDFSDA